MYSCTNKIDTEIQRSKCMSKVSKVAQYTLKGCNVMYVEDVKDGQRTYTHIFPHNFLNNQPIFNPEKVLESWDLELFNHIKYCVRLSISKMLRITLCNTIWRVHIILVLRLKMSKMWNTMNNWSNAVYIKGVKDVKYYE